MFTNTRDMPQTTHDATTRRTLQKRATRAAVLDAARQLFAERGFEQTTMRDIAAAANVAVGTLFTHFADKRVLLSEALHDQLDVVLQSARASAPGGGVPRLLHLSEHLFAYYAAHPALSAVLVKESLVSPLSERSEQVLLDFLHDAGQSLEAAGLLRPDVTASDAASVFFALYLAVLLGGLRADSMPVQDMTQQLARLLHITFPDRTVRA
jgi:AcrR family transcriptional regulator